MPTWNGNIWPNLRGLVTTTGTFTSVYRPGAGGEIVIVTTPAGQMINTHCPALHDWFLAAENNQVTVYYSQIIEGGHQLVRVPTGIPCGQGAGATLVTIVGPVGPVGPQGEPGPPGPAGRDGVNSVDGDASAKLGDYLQPDASVTVRNHLAAIEAQANGSRADAQYLAERLQDMQRQLDALAGALAALSAAKP